MENTIKSLNLRTGELNDNNQGREIFRVYRHTGENDQIYYLNIKISFPVYNATTDEHFWLHAETCIDVDHAELLLKYLEDWTEGEISLKSGEKFDETLSLQDSWLKSMNVPSKKIRIIIPPTSTRNKRTAISQLSIENAQLLADYIREFVNEVDRRGEEDEAVEEIGDQEIDALNDRIHTMEESLERLVAELDDAKEQLSKMLEEAC